MTFDPERQPQLTSRWKPSLSSEEEEILSHARFGRRMGFGRMPALIVIDAQRYMLGSREESRSSGFPSASGDQGWRALERIIELRDSAHDHKVPVILTQFVLDPTGKDAGVYALKREFMRVDDWCLEGTPGSELVPELVPTPSDYVIRKNKPSAFFGTPLAGILIALGVDTLVVAGGSTSNCVQATVFDSASYNFRTVVAADAVFDRFARSHEVNLFDMDRQFADVMYSSEIIRCFEQRDKSG